jgi:hypothetical protein
MVDLGVGVKWSNVAWMVDLGVGIKWTNVFWMYHNYKGCMIFPCSHLIQIHKILWKHNMVHECSCVKIIFIFFFSLIVLFHFISLEFYTISITLLTTIPPFLGIIFWILKLNKNVKNLKNICTSNCTLDLI